MTAQNHNPPFIIPTGLQIRPCFCCGKPLERDTDRDEDPLRSNWVGGTDWESWGNWCSTKLDCMMDDNHYKAQIVICDECFEKYRERILLLEYTDEQKKKLKEERRQRTIALQKWLKEGR